MSNDLSGSTFGGFRLLRLLGAGGMSTVYSAENELNPRIRRAIKVVHAQLAAEPTFLARFAAEAEVLERLTHPNVLRFYGIRKEQGQVFLELELLEGQSLESRAHHPNSTEEVVGWIRQAALGVGAAHAAGVVHRDIKPDNLFLCNDGVVKVLDFGIAHAAGAIRQTAHGMVAGTAGYLAPEVCKGEEPGPAADVYALGICLYELLLGRHPLIPVGSSMSVSSVQLLLAHVEGNLPPVPGLPPPLLAVLRAATERDPARRFADGQSLATALEQALEGKAVDESPERRDKTRLLVLPDFPVDKPEKPPVKVEPPPKVPETVLTKGVQEAQFLDVAKIQAIAEKERKAQQTRRMLALGAVVVVLMIGVVLLGGGGWWWSGRHARDLKLACKVVGEAMKDGQASESQRETSIRRGWDDQLSTVEVKEGLEGVIKKPKGERMAAVQALASSLGEGRVVCPEMEELWPEAAVVPSDAPPGSYRAALEAAVAAQNPPETQDSLVGKAAPPLEVDWYQGSAAYHPGKTTVVLLWDPGCHYCEAFLPNLQPLADGASGLEFVALTCNENRTWLPGRKPAADALALLQSNGVKVAGGQEKNCGFSSALKVTAIPEAFAIRDGTIRWQGHPTTITPELLQSWQ